MSEEEKQAVPEDNAPVAETKSPTKTQSAYQGDSHTTDFREDGMWPEYANPNYRMPEEIEVHVKAPTGDYSFPVQVVKSTTRKLYYGGYRHAKNKRVYHNASTQTPIESKNAEGGTKLRTRETQTYDMRSISVQPCREHGTQMQRVDLYLDDSRDKEITPKAYFNSEDLLFLKREKCVELQRVWRGFMARGRADRMRKAMVANEERELAEREQIYEANKAARMAEMKRRNEPTTNADFARLFNELDVWRKAEVTKIKTNTPPGEERRVALAALLAEETKALQNIQRLKATAHETTTRSKTQKMLELMAQPQQWQMRDGEIAQVQTPSTIRAKELLDLYNALNAPLTNTNERLEILLNVKWTVKESTAQHSHYSINTSCNKDIVELVDREADLLNRGRSYKSMESLRTRLSNLFLQFIENPAYNPRAEEFINIPIPAPPSRT
mmetsp:Transcript_11235/g.18296  ORF Transcript_11235/g.18296 Transcript_11235/m.18296 type:complete len:441 (+) Transcript_11235:80-1402(+)